MQNSMNSRNLKASLPSLLVTKCQHSLTVLCLYALKHYVFFIHSVEDAREIYGKSWTRETTMKNRYSPSLPLPYHLGVLAPIFCCVRGRDKARLFMSPSSREWCVAHKRFLGTLGSDLKVWITSLTSRVGVGQFDLTGTDNQIFATELWERITLQWIQNPRFVRIDLALLSRLCKSENASQRTDQTSIHVFQCPSVIFFLSSICAKCIIFGSTLSTYNEIQVSSCTCKLPDGQNDVSFWPRNLWPWI